MNEERVAATFIDTSQSRGVARKGHREGPRGTRVLHYPNCSTRRAKQGKRTAKGRSYLLGRLAGAREHLYRLKRHREAGLKNQV